MNYEFRNIIESIGNQYGLKKGEVAKRLGVTPSYLSRLVTGMQEPSDAIRLKINQAFPDLEVEGHKSKNYSPAVESAILMFMKSKAYTIGDLAKQLNQKPSQVNDAIFGGFSEDTAERWANAFGFSASFLMTGAGALIEAKESYKTVPLLPITAQAGHLADFSTAISEYECERVISPIKDAELAIPISGESMYPEFPSGSVVYVRKINEKSFIEWGKAYVLDTINGPVVKYLAPGQSEEYVKCISANPSPMYAPFEVPLCDVLGIYRIVNMLCVK